MNKSNAQDNCIVPGCSSTQSRHPHLEFHPIPINKVEEWLTAINRRALLGEWSSRLKNSRGSRYRVCSLHFDDSMMILHRTLSENATPAFNLPEKNDSENLFVTDKIVQTEANENFEKTRFWELNDATFINTQQLIVREKRTMSTQTIHQNLSPNMLPSQVTQCTNIQNAVFIREDGNEKKCLLNESNEEFENPLTELNGWLKNGNFKDLKNMNLFKKFALALYFSCTPLYDNIQTELHLPVVSSLMKLNIDISCLQDRPIVNLYLAEKLNLMGNKSKYCILFFDAIDIKPHVYYNITKDKLVGLHHNTPNKTDKCSNLKATKAYFMMLRGINHDWQQLMSCFFINQEKFNLSDYRMDYTLQTLANLDFQVKTIVLRPDPCMYKYAKEGLKVTSEKPYVKFDSMVLYFMFEPRDLVLQIRNLLFENNFYDNKNGKISWDYVKDLYKHKEKYKLTILPTLTKAHVFPDEEQKTEYKYAFEIFSDEISSTLELYISLSLIPRDALPTARFIRSISFLIDIYSSNTVNHDNELKCAFQMNKKQCSVILYLQELIRTLSIVCKGRKSLKTPYIFDCVLISIHSLILLNNGLKEVGISHFMTRRVHLDPLDKLKKKIKNASKGKVTAVKFIKILGTQFIKQLIQDKKLYDITNNLKELSKRANEIVSAFRILEKNQILQQSNIYAKRKTIPLKTKSLNGDFDYQFNLPEKHKLTYLAAYLFFKCYKKHRCSVIELEWNKMKCCDDIPWTIGLPITLKGNLRTPTSTFQQIINEFEQTFVLNFIRAKNVPIQNLFSVLKKVSKKYEIVCKCFPVDYLLLLFLRHRIYSVLMCNKRKLNKTLVVVSSIMYTVVSSP